MALLVFIWLTTGAGYFWPQWAIVGWGLLLALHAWFAEGRRPGYARQRDATGPMRGGMGAKKKAAKAGAAA